MDRLIRNQKHREYRIRNLEKMRKYDREHYQKHDKQYCLEHRDKFREYSRKHKQKMRQKLLKTIGKKCIFCGFDKPIGIEFHQIYGKKHGGYAYILRNKKDFIPVCIFCHRALTKLTKLDLKNLAKFLTYLQITKGLNRAKEYYNLKKVCKSWFELLEKLI